jgi:murein L,D-transpeptidase YcbB/YkuD
MKFEALGNILFLIAVFTIITLIPHKVEQETDFVTFKISRHESSEKASYESASISSDYQEATEENSTNEDLFRVEEIEKTDESSEVTKPKVVEKDKRVEEQKAETSSVKVVNDEEKRISDRAHSEFAKLDKQSGLSDEAYFKQFVKIYKEAWVKGVHPEFRKDVVIRYYVKEDDGDAIFSLRQFGYYIHERPTSERFNMLPSNALYYGSQVNVEDIKMVAYSLMSQGVVFKTIEPSQFSDDWKANSIEIGADDTILEEPVISLAQLRKFSIK